MPAGRDPGLQESIIGEIVIGVTVLSGILRIAINVLHDNNENIPLFVLEVLSNCYCCKVIVCSSKSSLTEYIARVLWMYNFANTLQFKNLYVHCCFRSLHMKSYNCNESTQYFVINNCSLSRIVTGTYAYKAMMPSKQDPEASATTVT